MLFPKEWKEQGIDPETLPVHAIEMDRWDLADLERLVREINQLSAAREQLAKGVTTGRPAMDDALMALYKVQPKTQEVRPSHRPNKAVADELLTLPETDRLRRFTVNDDVQAALSASGLLPELRQLFDKHQAQQRSAAEKLEKLLEQLHQVRQQQESLEEMIERWATDADPSDLGEIAQAFEFLEQRDDLAEQATTVQGQIGEAESELSEAETNEQGCFGQLVQAVGREANKAEEIRAAASAWGTEPGELRHLDPRRRMKLAQTLNNPKVRRLADMIGAMRNIMLTEQKRKVEYLREEFHDVGLGNDISRVLPTEWFLSEACPEEFFRRFLEGGLMQYEMIGHETLSKGGIILLKDSSGSMAGEKDEWASAVGVVLLHLARKQKRPMHFIHFGSARELRSFSFTKPTDFAIENVIEAATLFFNGGTDFMKPLGHARALLEAEYTATGAVQGDIVMVTDGQAPVHDPWFNQFKKDQERLGFRVFGFNIGGSRKAQPLNKLCDDQVWTVSDLLSGEDLRPMLRTL